VLVHNGNLTNAQALKMELFTTDHRHINTESDSEVLLNVLAHELEKATRGAAAQAGAMCLRPSRRAQAHQGFLCGDRADRRSWRAGVSRSRSASARCVLGTAKTDGKTCDGGQRIGGAGRHRAPCVRARHVEPGEAVFIDLCRASACQQCAANPKLNPCIFEYVYLARPDSVLDGISVYQARLNLGETLAKRVVSTVPPSEIDVIIPIPESSRPSATQLAHLLGIPYREGFVKNRYVGRTFIMPGQGVRKKSVRQKLNVIASEFKGRNVLLVDDSIVRGTTSERSCRWRATPARARSTWPAPPRRCATPMCMASTCPRR
jgi:amidophosphoribosyltransferase